MIKINLNLFATLAEHLPENPAAYPVPGGTTLSTLVRQLGIEQDQVKLTFVNGKRQDMDYCLKAGDRVGIFPPVGGG